MRIVRMLLVCGLVLACLAEQPRAQNVFTFQPTTVSAIVNGTTTKGSGFFPYSAFGAIDLLIALQAGSVATGTLQLYLEDSADGGTTWDDVCASNTFAFGAAAVTQRFFVGGGLAATGTQGSAAAVETLAAGTCRQGPFGDRFRIREKISAIAGSPTGVTYAITGTVQ